MEVRRLTSSRGCNPVCIYTQLYDWKPSGQNMCFWFGLVLFSFYTLHFRWAFVFLLTCFPPSFCVIFLLNLWTVYEWLWRRVFWVFKMLFSAANKKHFKPSDRKWVSVLFRVLKPWRADVYGFVVPKWKWWCFEFFSSTIIMNLNQHPVKPLLVFQM